MKVSFAILVLSLAAIIVAVGATWWRLRWHLRRPHHTPGSETPEQPQPAAEAEHAASADHSH
jgi:hypothetical protein